MKKRSWRVCLRVLGMVLACGSWFGTSATAQAPVRALAAGEIESDPIKCWWKTNKNTVQVGEQFTLALTCGVVETSRIRVVPAADQLDPANLQLTPFEVIAGARHEDIQAPPWRYVQYEYTMRLLGAGFFGQDIDVPSINVAYNIQSAAASGTQGRDQTYLLPALPMRIMSLVPKRATDIRDASRETFGDIEARRFRGTEELVAAGLFFGFAVVLVGLALVRLAHRHRARVPATARPLPPRVVLRGCLCALGRLKSDVASQGWTPELATRALTIFRLAGAVAIGRPISQTPSEMHVPEREGQLGLRKGLLRPGRTMISSPTTTDAIVRQLGKGRASDPRTQAVLEQIRDALRVLSVARYGRDHQLDTTALDAALDEGASAVRRLRFTRPRLRRLTASLAQAPGGR